MGYGDYYWGFYRDYYRDPFPHSLQAPDRLCPVLMASAVLGHCMPSTAVATSFDLSTASLSCDELL